MSIDDISSLFTFVGGVGMFLYGMRIMGDGMQKSAGSKMNHFLGMVTNNRFLGVVLGALITAILQSSGATTVMVVGFVNAGILSLTQAVGVIMGANIGTTITAWIVSLNQLGDAFRVMQPAFFAPLFIGMGAVMLLFSKRQRVNVIGEILTGLGLLFLGLDLMSGAISPYTKAPVFSQVFALLGGNPILGILAGALVTALLQSSSASVGILQTLAMNGVVTKGAAIYLTLGQNIGSCVTAMISSAGANRTAKRAAVIHLTFNVLGALIFGVGMYLLSMFLPQMAQSNINSVEISIFHTFFNLTNTMLLFPFASQLVKVSGVLVKEGTASAVEETEDETTIALRHLDKRIFESPAIAVDIVSQEVVHMGQIALSNVKLAMEAIVSQDQENIERVYENEKIIDHMEELLTEYLIKVNNLSLTEHQKLVVNNLFYSITDIERVGDHSENLAESALYMREHDVHITETGIEDLREMGEQVVAAFSHAVMARQKLEMDDVRKVSQYEDIVDSMEEELRDKHIERLSKGECNPSSGVVFLDIISNLERISDHAYNLAGYIKNEM